MCVGGGGGSPDSLFSWGSTEDASGSWRGVSEMWDIGRGLLGPWDILCLDEYGLHHVVLLKALC